MLYMVPLSWFYFLYILHAQAIRTAPQTFYMRFVFNAIHMPRQHAEALLKTCRRHLCLSSEEGSGTFLLLLKTPYLSPHHTRSAKYLTSRAARCIATVDVLERCCELQLEAIA